MTILDPIDPTKAEVRVSQNGAELEFDFYIPRGAKGEPGGFTAGTLLGDVNLDTILTPGLYRNWTAANAKVANNYPASAAGMNGTLEVLSAANTTDLLQRLTPTSGPAAANKVFYTRRFAGAWSGWTVYASQRVDTTAGRAIYTWDDVNAREQLIYGDTGWRDMWADLLAIDPAATKVPGFAGVRIRRTLQHVHIEAGFNTALIQPTDWRPALMPNTSWRPDAPSNIQWTGAQTGSAGVIHFSPNNYVRNWTAGNVIIVGTYPCSGPWPATLPGTAVGSIPNL